jgi:hypothetical protein
MPKIVSSGCILQFLGFEQENLAIYRPGDPRNISLADVQVHTVRINMQQKQHVVDQEER